MNNRGFTLVEVLSAVTIMVLITIIAVPTSIRFVEKGKNEQYNILEGQIISAASKYYIKHKNEKCITLDKLVNDIDDKFIKDDDIIDPRSNKKLTGIVEVKIEDNKKVKYNFVFDSDVCKSPTLAKSWYKSNTTNRSDITKINIVDSATSDIINTATERWNAADNSTENITCYLDETTKTLTIAGNGSGKIMANHDSSLMFDSFSNLTEINGFALLDTSNVENMMYMFLLCGKLQTVDLSNLNTSNVKNMYGMFYWCSSLTSLDLSNFNTSKVENMGDMFNFCNNLTTIYASDKFVTTAVENSKNMFYSNSNLVGGNGTSWNSSYIDHTHARIDKPGEPGYFTQK